MAQLVPLFELKNPHSIAHRKMGLSFQSNEALELAAARGSRRCAIGVNNDGSSVVYVDLDNGDGVCYLQIFCAFAISLALKIRRWPMMQTLGFLLAFRLLPKIRTFYRMWQISDRERVEVLSRCMKEISMRSDGGEI